MMIYLLEVYILIFIYQFLVLEQSNSKYLIFLLNIVLQSLLNNENLINSSTD